MVENFPSVAVGTKVWTGAAGLCGHLVAEVAVPQPPLLERDRRTGRELAYMSLCLGGQGLAFAADAFFVAPG